MLTCFIAYMLRELKDHGVCMFSALVEIAREFPVRLFPFILPPEVCESVITCCDQLLIISIFHFSYSDWYDVALIMVLFYIFKIEIFKYHKIHSLQLSTF